MFVHRFLKLFGTHCIQQFSTTGQSRSWFSDTLGHFSIISNEPRLLSVVYIGSERFGLVLVPVQQNLEPNWVVWFLVLKKRPKTKLNWTLASLVTMQKYRASRTVRTAAMSGAKCQWSASAKRVGEAYQQSVGEVCWWPVLCQRNEGQNIKLK